MGKALLLIVIAAALGGSVMMLQSQETERQTEQQLVESEAEFLAREAARSGYEVGVGEVALDFASRPARMNVRTANVPQGSYDLTVEETPEATLVVTATGRGVHGMLGGGATWEEHALWGEFSRIAEAPSAIVIDAEEVTSTFVQDDFMISGYDMRPFGTAPVGESPVAGLSPASYAVLATQPGVAAAFRSGLQGQQASRVEGRSEESATGAISQGGEYPALFQGIYDEAVARVNSGAPDVVSYIGDRVFSGTETFGSSPLNPKIVHIDGDVVIQGKVRGHGVLIVEGDLTINGLSGDAQDNFAWEGLVFVRDEGTVSFSQTGPTRIDGGLVVQAPPPEETEDPIDFEIDDEGEIEVNERFAARVEVLGAAMSWNDYDIPGTLGIEVGGDAYAPWGDPTQALSGNINDGQNPRSFDVPDLYEAGERIVIEARSFAPSRSNWYQHLHVRSGGSNNQLVKVLRDGDQVPDISGFQNQTSIAGYVDDYVIDGRVRLEDNQAIYLFELITTDLDSPIADFQDAVVLVTLSKEGEVIAGGGTTGGEGAAGGGGSTLGTGSTSHVNFTIGGEAEIRYSSEAIGRLAAHLQSARTVAVVKSINQRSFDPTQTYEAMPTTPGQDEGEIGGGDIDGDALVTVCLDGETQTITMAEFGQQADNATLGPCTGSGSDSVTVCHRERKTKEIGASALPAHLAHGDTVGSCRTRSDNDDDNDEDEDD